MPKLRAIAAKDNAELAKIIRAALTEFGAAKPGTVYYDSSTDHLYELFQQKGACYFVLEEGETILGGGGLFPTAGLDPQTCELVKMYLRPEARGKGYGKLLIEACEAAAKSMGFAAIYLETLPELKQAITIYRKSGYTQLEKAMGNSGHFGCNLWMLKKL